MNSQPLTLNLEPGFIPEHAQKGATRRVGINTADGGKELFQARVCRAQEPPPPLQYVAGELLKPAPQRPALWQSGVGILPQQGGRNSKPETLRGCVIVLKVLMSLSPNIASAAVFHARPGLNIPFLLRALMQDFSLLFPSPCKRLEV
ncbi:LIM domain-binding protein 1 [Platysternon megacephalum]|uniref:LIM domain-binding protein 1 n=1 Tax=Platysternon megacephalum TaxID=55544 RepID=A0A4D9DGE5_9SAUR|nr:LIM domain-binding protein 1 [Platysternon megacephalum]